ncbi:MAG: type II toxin-antitoxin system VapC family toxin [Deltaproteobacteria bacterium]|nr:type II toxin-antitoxin system VapC family toxin [Deltaproteobacteria bacterium]MBW2534768.1 type II toxin-antitoxin system VapC family toxin [Deltaproteobacteria bacterium]
MSRLCLDTSAYSNFRRAAPEVVSLLDAASWVGVPAIVLGELRTGFRLGRAPDDNELALHRFLANPAVAIVEVDDEAASIYADIVVALREAGTPVPTNDIWIAATAVRERATVVTYDRHFSQIRRAGVRILEAGR